MANAYSGFSDRATEGYFRNMANADAREQNAYIRRRQDEQDSMARENTMINRQQQNEQVKMQRFSEAAKIAVNNPDAAMQFLAQWGEQPSPEVKEMLIAYGAAISGGQENAFGNPIYMQDEQGNTIPAQLTNRGRLNIPQIPQGMSVIDPVKFMNTGSQIQAFDPRNPTAVQTIAPVTPKPEQMPEFRAGVRAAETIAGEQTPGGQANLEAQRLANEQALQKAEEARKKTELAQRAKNEIADLVVEISGMELAPVYGSVQGALPSMRQSSVDAESAIKRLGNMLTLDNLGKMSGVLTDRDIEILASAASELQNFRIGDERANREIARIARILGIQLDGGQGSARAQETYEERRARILGK